MALAIFSYFPGYSTRVLVLSQLEADVLGLEEFHPVQVLIQRLEVEFLWFENVVEREGRVQIGHVVLVHVRVAFFGEIG